MRSSSPFPRPGAVARRTRAATFATPVLLGLATTTAALTGCATRATPYVDPPADARATLRVDAPRLDTLQVHPDGDRCGLVLDLDAAHDPLQRADRTVAIASGQPVTLRMSWTRKWLKSCTALLRFVPAAGGAYRVSVTPYVDGCEAYVEAVPGTGTAAPVVTGMRQAPIDPAGCNP